MKNLFSTYFILVVLFFSSCTSSEKPAKSSSDTLLPAETHTVYTCPMHPEVLSDKPGTCPQCKMDLVVKGDEASHGDSTLNEQHHEGHQQ